MKITLALLLKRRSFQIMVCLPEWLYEYFRRFFKLIINLLNANLFKFQSSEK